MHRRLGMVARCWCQGPTSNTRVLSAVATIDVIPLPLGLVQPARVTVPPQSLHLPLNPGSATGY